MNAPATALSILLLVVALLSAALAHESDILLAYLLPGALVFAAVLTQSSLLVAKQWEKAVVLRLGRLRATRGPGLFVIVPFIDQVTAWIDQRIQTIEFSAEKALTKDTVPANIDAILFWRVHDVERAALEITDYRSAIIRVAQTSLRETIGALPLSALMSERRLVDQRIKDEIGRKIADWGVAAISVEIRDVAIPAELQESMSRQAQAEREKAARIILSAAEAEIAEKFLEAASIYGRNPAALQLRAMNIVYETTKERGATSLMPSAMVDSMNPAGVLSITAARTDHT
jgi:regulator of protease activity HflC (stomatin/prohibitin superfamily)